MKKIKSRFILGYFKSQRVLPIAELKLYILSV